MSVHVGPNEQRFWCHRINYFSKSILCFLRIKTMYRINISHRRHDLINCGNGGLRSERPVSKENNSSENIRCHTLNLEKLQPNCQTSSLKGQYAFPEANSGARGRAYLSATGKPTETRSVKGHSAGNCTAVSKSIR